MPLPANTFLVCAFSCQECGKKFRTTKSAEKASHNGCPKCHGTDIDIDRCVPAKLVTRKA